MTWGFDWNMKSVDLDCFLIDIFDKIRFVNKINGLGLLLVVLKMEPLLNHYICYKEEYVITY